MLLTKYPKKLDKSFVNGFRKETPPWGPLGYVVYKRTYSRGNEEWADTLERGVNGLLDLGLRMGQEEVETLFTYLFTMKCSLAGRSLWQLGTPTVERLGGDSLMNCWNVAVRSRRAFTFLFDELMLGGGVGANVHPHHVYSMGEVRFNPTITHKDSSDVTFIVPDNREGWVELLSRVMESYFETGKDFSYSTHCVRHAGTPLKGFGGTASGPTPLVKGIQKITNIMSDRHGRKLRPVDCLDIINIIGQVVVAGNVRRSAEIVCGSAYDRLFLKSKDWSTGEIPNHRAMSNNSILCSDIHELGPSFWDTFRSGGEPMGLVNLNNFRRYGRLKDGANYKDPHITGVNPCGEIGLESFESCNLAEIFLPNCSESEFETCGYLLTKVCKTLSLAPFQHPETQRVVNRNHRLGISIAGFCQRPMVREEVFDRVYKRIVATDVEYSKEVGSSKSIKYTCVKPGGTLPCLPGVTSGVSPAAYKYYNRNIRFASSDPLVKTAKINGYMVEPLKNLDGSKNFDTMVVSFPCKAPEGAIVAKDLSVVQQMENVAWLQTHWADNAVSNTVYYEMQDLPVIQNWLDDNYNDKVKSISFLPYFHGFSQAPFEEITEEQYKMTNRPPITSVSGDSMLDVECGKGGCPVR